MNNGEILALIGTILLAIFGCAQGIRRLCLWLTRCPRCVRRYRLAVPEKGVSLEPLIRCLQAESVWNEESCKGTLLLLTREDLAQDTLISVLEESPSVTPLTVEDLLSLLENE